MQSTYLQKQTVKPINTDYDYKLEEPINDFESALSYDPYKISVTTQSAHQHLTETTPIVRPIPTLHYHQNLTNINTKPFIYSDFIPTTSPKPLHEILHNMNKTSLQLLLTKLKDNNYLPKTFTMNKFDNSLKTLSKVLDDLKKTQKPIKNYEQSLAPLPSLSAPHPPKLQPIIKDHYEHHVKPIRPIKNKHGKYFIFFVESFCLLFFFFISSNLIFFHFQLRYLDQVKCLMLITLAKKHFFFIYILHIFANLMKLIKNLIFNR